MFVQLINKFEYFNCLKIKVLRFWNSEVDENIEEVLVKIKNEIG